MAHHPHKQPACANCHFAFEPGQPDEFCPRCGQQNHAVDISFYHVVEEFLEGVFHFDGKVFNTAKLLLFKPGELTRQFLAGHRVPYVPPIRLYVFISFVFFFLLALQRSHQREDRLPLTERIQTIQNSQATDSLQQATQPAMSVTLGANDAAKPAAGSTQKRKKEGFSLLINYLTKEEQARLPADITDAQADSVLRSHRQELTFWKRLELKRYVRWRDITIDELVHQGFRGLSLTMFLLMPLAALLLKGCYFRQQGYYLGHLIFTIHVHCFLFLFFSLLLLLGKVPGVKQAVVWMWWLPIPYFGMALHNVYSQSWGKTALKASLLGITYWLVLLLSFALVFTIVALSV